MENLHAKQSETKEALSGQEAQCFIREMVRQNRDEVRTQVIKRLRLQTREELIRGFLVEMEAKNQAYYFILERGYFEEFGSYCTLGA